MIEILRTGSHMCIVDTGRLGYRSYGVPVSGAMDLRSAVSANSLLNNDISAATIEMYMSGHQLLFQSDSRIALTGAQADVHINDTRLYTDIALKISAGDRLSIGAMNRGSRIYLAVSGGLHTTSLLGSRSPITGYFPRTLSKGDKIDITTAASRKPPSSRISPLQIDSAKAIECHIGPEWHYLSTVQQKALLSNIYTINHQSNRMGYRLQGSEIILENSEIYSSSVMPGTIQLPPSGLPIILMRDCQTTGGYPRVLQVRQEDINQLAQRRPGAELRFDVKYYRAVTQSLS